MSTREDILERLADGNWHSGAGIASGLNISRTAVWKHMAALEAMGLDIRAIRGRGYRLGSAVEWLRSEKIRAHLAGEDHVPLDVLLSVDSTNRFLMQRAAAPALCFAEHQSAGRGRRGRDWHSPFGGNLYMSVAWLFDEMPPGFQALGLAMGTAVASYLAGLGLTEIGLKWPNDVFWQDRKMGGILIEQRGESGGAWQVVVGTGLNLHMNQSGAAHIGQPWVDLATAAERSGMTFPGRNALAGGLARSVLQALQAFQSHGFSHFHDEWRRFDSLRGREVTVIQNERDIAGIARGIDGQGALLVDSGGEMNSYVSGEVSLRLRSAGPGSN
jgi:BirA family biotin operon repressor/biotin-[acetyl-CoA-carboxylase] ligase